MNKPVFRPIIRAGVAAASFALCACAAGKPAASTPIRPVLAADAAAAPAHAPVPLPSGSLTSVAGVVVSVDAATRALTIKDYGGQTRTFMLADGASLTKGGANSAAQLSDLAVGDRVKLKVSANVAASVHVRIKPAS